MIILGVMSSTMKLFRISLAAACVAALPLTLSAQANSSDEAEIASAKPRVGPGMTADQVRAIIGKPREVRKIDAEGVTGESWIYRRVAKRVINQVAPTTAKVPTWGGPGVNRANGEIIEVDVPFTRNERVTIYQMTALLFIDGKVTASKQWLERESLFD